MKMKHTFGILVQEEWGLELDLQVSGDRFHEIFRA